MSSPSPGAEIDDADVGNLGDVDLVLAGADGFQQDPVEAGRVEGVDDAHGGRGEAPQVATACQRAHEHAVVVEGRGHADAITEDGAAGDRA